MFFKKKSDKCKNCKSSVKEDFSYCPFCGKSMMSHEQKKDEYGMIGNHDGPENMAEEGSMNLTDKMISSILQSFMKNLDKQFLKEIENAQVTHLPNGIKINLGQPQPKKQSAPKIVKRAVTEEQLARISKLPRKTAKTQIKRLGDKVVYELATPGVNATEDVFVSRLESGYEVKALGEKKMYVNTLPISLPIKSVILEKDRLRVEFHAQHQE